MDTLYAEPAYYRMLFDGRTQDQPFYLRWASGEVLEIGVGAGRMALALARAGHRVTGVDLAPEMVSEVERRLQDEPAEVRERVRVLAADARTMRLGRTFERVILPFNGIAHYLTSADASALFATVREHLVAGGLFVFDAMLPDPMLLGGGASATPTFRHPRTGAPVRAEEKYEYDVLAQILRITTTIQEREREDARQVLQLSLRQYFPQETLLLLDHHGFDVVEREEGLGDTLGYVCRARH